MIIRKTRRLPLKGEVMVEVDDFVQPEAVVARTELPGIMQTVRVAEQLGLESSDVEKALRVAVGDQVERGTVIAEAKSFFGLVKNEVKSPIEGTVELISPISGHVGIRHKPTPVEVKAYIRGKVVEIIPEEGVVVETGGALVQGIFGVGGERLGEIKAVVARPTDVTRDDRITEDLAGKVVVCGSNITGEALRKAAEIGVAAVVVGGIIDKDLIDYLGYDIGVAITGQESIPTSVIVTEGFGVIKMANRTFDLLSSFEGRQASVNGATQIRAGVIRPEIIVPSAEPQEAAKSGDEQVLDVGSKIRIIREPHFGLLGEVTALPPEPALIESGAKVRILEAKLESGDDVLVPRANVEIVQE
jgi:biotin carboxyl carrier protein